MIDADCTIECTRTPECTVCGKRKSLRGRSYPLEMANGYCDHECDGYNQEPRSGHVWPSEWREHESGDHGGCSHG